ncbi:hypothetical protein CEXT_802161 [Caerostris extrusa]|uniref:Uncharacterized protein n=1 Tax=Caerostris extrusa TaxID=172846 RepID=A0AAV4T922_CAEEX|nr:hypothetical protein CEXT_802161 [Caerostris extrusa]
MDENLRQIHQYLEHMTEELENIILLASNVFNRIEQSCVCTYGVDPKTLTADECRAREPKTTFLINRLQAHRKETDNIMKIYEMIVCKVKNCNHSTLLYRLERSIKWKIRELWQKVLRKELLVDCYQIKLECRKNMSKFTRSE